MKHFVRMTRISCSSSETCAMLTQTSQEDGRVIFERPKFFKYKNTKSHDSSSCATCAPITPQPGKLKPPLAGRSSAKPRYQKIRLQTRAKTDSTTKWLASASTSPILDSIQSWGNIESVSK